MALPKKLTQEKLDQLLDKYYEMEGEEFNTAILFDEDVRPLNLSESQEDELKDEMRALKEIRYIQETAGDVRQEVHGPAS